MKRIAIFGKPGSGKSTLSQKLAAQTGIPLHQLDSIMYQPNGTVIDRQAFDTAHEHIMAEDQWIIDGLGPIDAFFKRLEQADTLIYIDLPYWLCYWLVTKRLIKAIFVHPDGWPEGCSVLKGTWQSYKTLKLCPKFWNDRFAASLDELSGQRTVLIIRSLSDFNDLIHLRSSLNK